MRPEPLRWVRESEKAGRGRGCKAHRLIGLGIWWSLGNFGQGTKKELVSRTGSGEEWEIHRGFNYNEGVEGPTVGVGIEAGQSESLQGEVSRVGSQGTGETPAFFKDTAHL